MTAATEINLAWAAAIIAAVLVFYSWTLAPVTVGAAVAAAGLGIRNETYGPVVIGAIAGVIALPSLLMMV